MKWILLIGSIVRVLFFSPPIPVVIDSTSVLFLPNEFIISVPAQPRTGLPVRLKIPSIHIDAALERVGLAANGAMDVPKVPSEAAWFDLGPRPGEQGSAVIAGHFGPWKSGEESVFDDLHMLQAGDVISVEDEQGITTTFVVRELHTYGQHENIPDVFGSSDGKTHLNLVTCQGAWNSRSQSYSQRLVVFADAQ